jgi:hypothetical protein
MSHARTLHRSDDLLVEPLAVLYLDPIRARKIGASASFAAVRVTII